MPIPRDTARRGGAAGFSVVELMVAVTIGMLAIMFATRLIVGAEQNKSVALGGSDQMQNGMLALFSINEDAAQAGWGLNDNLVAGCNTIFSDTAGYALASADRGGVAVTPLAPVVIENNPNGSDRISLYTGSASSGVGSVKVTEAYASGSTLKIATAAPFGFLKDDVILVVPEPAGGNCALAQLTADPLTTTLTFSPISSARYNRASLGAAFAAGQARVFDLGQARSLALHTWSVQNGVLLLRASNLAGAMAAPSTVVDNIVAIKAQYGFSVGAGAFDTTAGWQMTRWSNTMINADGDVVTGSAIDYQRVVAVRIAVVARSKVPEKADPATGLCSATTDLPTVFASASPANVAAVPVAVNVAIPGDPISWKCYRYRAFESIVPIRNAGWRPT
jgi:type IV pilus assembly protein PilW